MPVENSRDVGKIPAYRKDGAARGGRIAGPFLCSDNAAFIADVDYPLDGGFHLHG